MKYLKQVPVGWLAGASLTLGVAFSACGGGSDKVILVDNGGSGGASGSAGSSTNNAGSSSAGKGGSTATAGSTGDAGAPNTTGGTGAGTGNGGDAGEAGATDGVSGTGGSGGTGGTGGAGTSGSGGSGTSGSGGSGGAAAMCNAVAQQGTPITPVTVSTAPVAAHGTIVAGTYVLTADQFYNFEAGFTFKVSTIVVTVVGTKATIQGSDDQQSTLDNYTNTIDPTTTPTDFEYTCFYPPQPPEQVPLNQPLYVDYTATPTTLKIIYGQAASGMEVETYTKK
jgi:hypothetical protein